MQPCKALRGEGFRKAPLPLCELSASVEEFAMRIDEEGLAAVPMRPKEDACFDLLEENE